MSDVVIVGGGPVGACAAALLRRGGLEVTLIEPHPPAPIEPCAPFDSRVVALSRASERTLRAAGAWPHIQGPRLCPYERMRIWHESADAASASALVFDAADVGEPNLGYILENRLLQCALLDAFTAGGGQLEHVALTGLTVTPQGVTVTTASGELTARLIVGADGAHSAVRAAAGLAADGNDYHQIALVANVATTKPHQHTAWQRFMKDGTLALLPLADGASSIVWSADEARARELIAATDEAFARALDEASAGVLGSTRLITERRNFALKRLAARHYVSSRVALLGDAAHVVHPLAGQGVNLGLLDAAALAELVLEAVSRREDPGALSVLRTYERWRKSEVALMATAIDAFDQYLAHGSGPVARAARTGLRLVNGSSELKRFFIERALGVKGELPRVARALL